MITSQKTAFLSEIEGSEPISDRSWAYLTERARNNLYDYVIRKFLAAEATGLKRADLARRIGWSASDLSHKLGAPGNWTIGTVTKLLVGICKEELKPDSVSFLTRPSVNYTQADILAGITAAQASDVGKDWPGLEHEEEKSSNTPNHNITVHDGIREGVKAA